MVMPTHKIGSGGSLYFKPLLPLKQFYIPDRENIQLATANLQHLICYAEVDVGNCLVETILNLVKRTTS